MRRCYVSRQLKTAENDFVLYINNTKVAAFFQLYMEF